MTQHAREPDPSSPFARYVNDERQPARPIAGELESAFLSESDSAPSPRRIRSRADVASESVADLFPSEAPRVAPRAAPPAPMPLPAPRQRWPVSMAPIWLVAAAIGGLAMGAGYSSILRGSPPRDERLAATDTAHSIDSIAPVATQASAAPPPLARPSRRAAQRPTSTRSAPKNSEAPRRTSSPSTRPAPRIGPPASAPRRPEREKLTPSALSALPHVPVAPPVTPSSPSGEPRKEAEDLREQRVIRSLLEAYRLAHERLDAMTVAALWPGVDSRSLTRAFNALKTQRMTFDRCTITITGAVATAQCDGMLTYARRVGDSDVESRRMTWAFALQRASGEWRISRINSR